MKIAIVGAGAIGCLVSGYLKDKGEDVSLIGHSDSLKAMHKIGLKISGVRGDFNFQIDISEKLNDRTDLVILATKTQDIDTAMKDNLEFLQDTIILTVQNGVQAENIVAKYVPKENIISSIVMFGATYLEPGVIVHNFEGGWILGKLFGDNDEKVAVISRTLNKIFPTQVTEEIKGMKYLKLFLNANNCIPAILGLSMQEAFSDVEISKIGIAIWREGLEVVNKAGIKLVSLPDFPWERLIKLTLLPITESAKIFSGIMVNLSKEPLYGSILQSIKRNRPSEIDCINGEFINLAKKNNLKAFLNEKLVELVHQVERTKRFFSKDEFLDNVKEVLN